VPGSIPVLKPREVAALLERLGSRRCASVAPTGSFAIPMAKLVAAELPCERSNFSSSGALKATLSYPDSDA
jgi:hypothetical protein